MIIIFLALYIDVIFLMLFEFFGLLNMSKIAHSTMKITKSITGQHEK